MAHDVFADLEAECALFDATLEQLDDEGWSHPTLCEGWDVRDVVAHLWLQADAVRQSLDGSADLFPFDVSDIQQLHDLIDESVRSSRDLDGREVWRRWRELREGAIDRLRSLPPGQRVQWTVSDMSPVTLGTTLVMEYWTHRYDVRAPLGLPIEETPAMRHIAWFANSTLPFAFSMAGEEFRPVRFEVQAPDGETWRFGPDDAQDVIRGSAVELCLRGVDRLDASEATTLTAEGETAEKALRLMKAYP